MELERQEWDKSEVYLNAYGRLMGDKRTRRTYQGIIRGIIDQAATEAILLKYVDEHGDLPPFIKRLLAAYGYKLSR